MRPSRKSPLPTPGDGESYLGDVPLPGWPKDNPIKGLSEVVLVASLEKRGCAGLPQDGCGGRGTTASSGVFRGGSGVRALTGGVFRLRRCFGSNKVGVDIG